MVDRQQLQEAIVVSGLTNNIYESIERKLEAIVAFLLDADGPPSTGRAETCDVCDERYGFRCVEHPDKPSGHDGCHSAARPCLVCRPADVLANLQDRMKDIEAALYVSDDDVADAETAVTVLETLVAKVANIEGFLNLVGPNAGPGYPDPDAQGGAGEAPEESTPPSTDAAASSPSSEYLCCVEECPNAQPGYGLPTWDELADHARVHGTELEAVEGGYVFRVPSAPSASGAPPYDVLPERPKLERMNIDTLLDLGQRHGIVTPDRSAGKAAIIDALLGKEPVT